MDCVALKIQRRRYSFEARCEIAIYQRLRDRIGACREIIGLREAFVHDGHLCLSFDLHGNSLCEALERGPLRPTRAQRVARQMFTALERLHRAGYAHTDVKPDNILYQPRSGEARLADLADAEPKLRQGTLYGTRQYTAPEMILGGPLTSAIDVWSLGCTIYEMLTDRLLFDPRAAAEKKYLEFQRDEGATNLPVAASVIKDEAEEEAEQLVRGTVLGEKYRLRCVLGRGRFSTVWAAELINDIPIDTSRKLLEEHNSSRRSNREKLGERQRQDRRWRHRKGAADLVDLTLNYEQLLLIAALCGKFPPSMVKSARYRGSYFEGDGELRFRPSVVKASLRDRLRRNSSLRGEALSLAIDLVRRCLTIEAHKRITAGSALSHPWLIDA